MAKILPAPDPFPGARPSGWTGPTNPGTPGWLLDSEPDAKDYDVPVDAAVAASITPGNKGADQGGKLSTNPFPGYPGSQPGGKSGAGGASGSGADDVIQTTRPDTSSMVGGYTVLSPPNAYPGGNQIPPGAADTTGTTGPRRLRRDNSAGGTLP
jgi:hypothetical protein